MGFAIIGTGVIAPLHATAIKLIPEAELVSVVDVNEEKAREFQKKFESTKSYTSLEDCLQDEAVDIVCICTPSGTHGNLAVRAAEAGKHILCEKPLEIQKDKMTAMINACRQAKVKLGVVYQRRLMGPTMKAKRMVEEGIFGKMTLADAHLKYYRDQAYYDSAGWRGTWEMDGGGALMNQGVHGIDLIQWFNGGIKKIFARAATMSRNIEVEDTAVALVEYNNGAFGTIQGSTLAYPSQMTRFELCGDEGTVIFDDKNILTCETLAGKVNQNDWKLEDDHVIPEVRSPGHYRYVYDMIRAVQEDRDPFVSGEEGRKAVDVILAIYESAKTGKEIILS